MSKNAFEIFHSEEDHFNWDKYDQQLDLIELSDVNRDRAREALRYLRGLLGEDFLRTGREKRHPMLFPYFMNAAPRARLLMVNLAEAIKALEKADKFDDLLSRIKHPATCAEALSVLNAAYKFLRAGFTISFEPVVNIPDRSGAMRPKMPDFKVTNDENKEEIFVEVSRLRTGFKQNQIDRTYKVIWDVVHGAMWTDPEAWENLLAPKHILPYAKIHRAMDDQELKRVVSQIVGLITQVKSTGQFQEMVIEGTIEVAVSPSHDHETGEKWAAARNMKDLVEGPLIDTDEVYRAKVKLRDKLEQLPDDKLGIIVMPTNENLLFWLFDIRYVIAELATELCKYPKLFAAVLSIEFMGSGQDKPIAAAVGQHVVVSKVKEDWATEQSVLLLNEGCGIRVSDSTFEKVRRAFIEN